MLGVNISNDEDGDDNALTAIGDIGSGDKGAVISVDMDDSFSVRSALS